MSNGTQHWDDDNDDFEITTPLIKVGTFAASDFHERYPEQFAEYVEWRVKGKQPHRAFMLTFGPAYHQNQYTAKRIDALEFNKAFQAAFEAKLKSTKVDDQWNTEKAIHSLLSLAEDEFVKDNVRLAAIKELNVLIGIVVVDENGKTKAGSSLADYYARVAELKAQTEAVREKVAQRTAETKAAKAVQPVQSVEAAVADSKKVGAERSEPKKGGGSFF
jgi:hypothetical protein